MILTKKDKQEIIDAVVEANRAIIQEELKALVMREIIMEQGPRKQGDPEGKAQKEMTVNVIDMCAEYLCRSEGAMRGLQADVDRTVNTVSEQGAQVHALCSLLLGMDGSIKTIAALSDMVKEHKPRLIEVSRESAS